MAAKVAKAKVDAVQEYKNSFKDMMDYLFLMRDAVNEYKASIKKVDPTFDEDYYDSLISGEPATPAPKDSFEMPEEEAEQEAPQSADSDQETAPAQVPVRPIEQPAEAPTASSANS